uniref:5'-3' DNA helicase ZGRF1 n=1 Tax=Cyanistes caeruleus TaxID=156563 RepID=A0A8C0VRN2_CYACU
MFSYFSFFPYFKQVLYTHQKMKKSKTWQDGILRVRTGRNQVTPGDDLESERYLITVEAVKVSEQPSKDQPKKAETPAVDRNGVKPALLSPRHLPVGLKRKFTVCFCSRFLYLMFTCVIKHKGHIFSWVGDTECQGSFPSKFYISSPLFSTIGKKDAETNPSAGCQEEGCRDSNREQMSVSSLLSAPCSDSCEETEKQNSSQFVVRPESPLLAGHPGPRAVSHHIRSTAQIIALLKSKPAQGHREQTSGVTDCLSRFQAAENAELCDKKSPVLPAFSGDPNKGLIPDTQHLPFMQGTVNDEKLWNAQTLPNSAGQPCGEEVTGQRQDKKVNNLSQELQDHCNTDSYFLPESTVSRMRDSQFVPSSGDISYSASPTTFENNPFGYGEHSGTDSPRENFSVKMQSELHPRQNSEGVSSDPGLSGDVILTEDGIVKEEFSLQGTNTSPDGELMEVNFNLMETFDFNDIDHEDVCEREGKEFSEGDSSWSPGCLQGEDVAQDAALRPHLKPHSCCEIETHSKNEMKCSIFDGDGGPPSQLCDSDARRTAADDAANQTKTKLSFPAVDKVKHASLPKRKISIPAVFQSHTHYKQVFKAALTEQLNIMLFELAQRLHNALSKVDISFYTALKDGQSQSQGSCAPLCNHRHPAKLVMVKKEGQNKGRLFYACDAPKAEQCSFFKWVEDVNPTQTKSRPSAVLHDTKSIGTYLRSQKIAVYEECQLLVRYPEMLCTSLKCCVNSSFDGDSKSKLYLKLSRKEHSSLYSKDDIWVVSKTLNFDPIDTFIASSAFFGPSSNNEIELLPLKGYSPSNWRSNMCVHALLVCNASGELASLRNLEEHFNPSTLPLIPYLLKMDFNSENATKRVDRRKFTPPAMSLKCSMMSGPVSSEVALGVAEEMIQRFSLNPDQAASLIHIAQMMTSCGSPKPGQGHQSFPITIIHGVFGAGKSYLLSVVILFLVQLFESSEATEGPRATPWKLLIASSTNVAVDRILLGLLDLGFEDFIRVGSIRKITKAILPHSLHAGSGNENEQLKELLALMKEDLTPAEKIYVRKSIEQHKLGTNKTILQQVKVVGVTCAACPFPCLNSLRFPVVMLDECSQMTEPASLLPIARFQCEKLVLVGDPKQLPPTIQGSESVHEQGLEQTLFDRLCLMGHNPILLRTQYRCHPALSAIANELFYRGNLIDGISEEDRTPLLEWLPTLCFYSVHGMEQIERDNSFYNMAEAHFTVKLIQSLIASGIEGAAIGVITLYKSQMYKIQNLLTGVHSEAFEVKPVQVSTVDAFQGAEREIIVLSCVRTRQFGFIGSEKRMNVALTRAKRHLLIVGSLPCLSRNRLWGRVIHHCKGWENGLQHASQCEQQLNDILKSYLENWEEEEQSKKKEK